MLALGIFAIWGGYTLVLLGYGYTKNWGISIGDLVIPGQFAGTWPPTEQPFSVDTSSVPSNSPTNNPNVPNEGAHQGQVNGG